MAQKSSSKRAGDELEQESIKKQKVDDDQETTKMKEHIEVVPDEEEVAINAIPLATKPPSIVNFKILKEGKISYFQIIRADGSSKRYSAFIHMLRSFDREDLETLWKFVKAKHRHTRPEDDYERVLWGRIIGIKIRLDDLRVTAAKNVVLAKSSSQPKSTYEAAESLTKFELKKILLDKLQKSKSYRGAKEHRDLYDAPVKSYQLNKDLFESYCEAYSLKRDCEGKDKDKDPPAGSDQGLKKRKTSKDAEPPKGSKSKDSKISSSKGTKSQPKSSGKSAQAEEAVFEAADTEIPQNQGSNLDDTDDQPNVEATPKRDCRIAQAEKPPLTFDELMSTPVDFSAYVMHNLKIDNMIQEHLVGPTFNLLKGTCRSRVKLEYHFEEYQGRQVVPAAYFFNNDLEYLKGIEDMVPSLWSPVKVAYDKYVVWGITR
ncbi:hypothetical protein Tco_1001537 [Tanacetum coccineum]